VGILLVILGTNISSVSPKKFFKQTMLKMVLLELVLVLGRVVLLLLSGWRRDRTGHGTGRGRAFEDDEEGGWENPEHGYGWEREEAFWGEDV